jgi:hypothetical protein
LSGWISTFRIEVFKLKCCPQSRPPSHLLWRRRSQTRRPSQTESFGHWSWMGSCRNWTSCWAILWNWRSSQTWWQEHFICASLPYIWCFYGVRIRDFNLGVVDFTSCPSRMLFVRGRAFCKMNYVMNLN